MCYHVVRAGVLPPSGGDALVYGESITSPEGMDRIRWRRVCVCCANVLVGSEMRGRPCCAILKAPPDVDALMRTCVQVADGRVPAV